MLFTQHRYLHNKCSEIRSHRCRKAGADLRVLHLEPDVRAEAPRLLRGSRLERRYGRRAELLRDVVRERLVDGREHGDYMR